MTVETSSNRSKAFPTFLNKTRYRNLRNLPYCVFKFAINTSGLSINYCCPSATLVESKKMSVHDLILNEPPVRPVSQKVAPNSTFFPGSLQHEEVTGARQWKWTGDPSAWRSRAPWTAPFSPFATPVRRYERAGHIAWPDCSCRVPHQNEFIPLLTVCWTLAARQCDAGHCLQCPGVLILIAGWFWTRKFHPITERTFHVLRCCL